MSARYPEFTSISPAVLQPRLPRIGNIKIGGTVAQQNKSWRRPVKFDHFQVTTRAKDANDCFIRDADVHKVLGEKPLELDVVLMFNEPHHNWQASFVAYQGKSLRCQGNGERAFDRVLGKEIPCTCPLLKQHQGGYPTDIARPIGQVSCKPYGVLSVLLPQAQTYGGFYVFRTTSWESIASITGTLQMLYQQFGGLAFLPLRMKLIPTTDRYEEGGQLKTSKSYKVGLVLAGGIDAAMQLAAGAQEQRAKLLQLSAGKAMYTPEEHVEQLQQIAQEEEGSVAEEWFPPQADGAGGGVVEADYEIEAETPEEQDQDALCRAALEYSDWEALRINRQIAKYEGRLEELVAVLDAQMPEAMAKAREELARQVAPVDSAAADEDLL